MATYAEIEQLMRLDEPTGLRNRVAVAALVAADNIRLEPDAPTDATVQARKRYAQSLYRQGFNSNLIFRDDNSSLALQVQFESIYRSVLTANKAATVAQITGATDAGIQTAVDDAVTFFATEFPDPVTP